MRPAAQLFLLAAVIAACAVGPSHAQQTCNPIAPSDILRHWERYTATRGANVFASTDLYECANIVAGKTVCRTKPGHPAHPSILIRTLKKESDGSIYLTTEGDTASTCKAFFQMIEDFRKAREDARRAQ